MSDSIKEYQGCGDAVIGTSECRQQLAEYEASGEWIAEPKLDGQWALLTQGLGPVTTLLSSRYNNVRDGRQWQIPNNTALVGELIGNVLTVFDVIAWQGHKVRKRPFAKRRRLLEAELARYCTANLRLVSQFRSGFAEAFQQEAEGLVLKRCDDGPYIGGLNPHWVKFKQADTWEVILSEVGARSASMVDAEGCDAGSVDVRGLEVHPGQRATIQAFGRFDSGKFRNPLIVHLELKEQEDEVR